MCMSTPILISARICRPLPLSAVRHLHVIQGVLRNFSASYRRFRGLAYRLRGEPQERLHNGAGEPAMPLHRAAELSQRTTIQVFAPFEEPFHLRKCPLQLLLVLAALALDSLLDGSEIEVVGQFGTVLSSDNRLIHVAVKVEASRRRLRVRQHKVGIYSFVRFSSKRTLPTSLRLRFGDLWLLGAS